MIGKKAWINLSIFIRNYYLSFLSMPRINPLPSANDLSTINTGEASPATRSLLAANTANGREEIIKRTRAAKDTHNKSIYSGDNIRLAASK